MSKGVRKEMKKGMTLPINTIVILALVLLALVVLGSFFIGKGSQGMNDAEAKKTIEIGCLSYEDQCNSGEDPYTLAAQLCGPISMGGESSNFGQKFLDSCEQLGYVGSTDKINYCYKCLREACSSRACDFGGNNPLMEAEEFIEQIKNPSTYSETAK